VAALSPNGSDINELYVGGSFDLKVVKLMASWQAQNDRSRSNFDNQTWSVGAVVPILSASNIHLSYAQQIWDQGSFYSRTGIPGVGVQVPALTLQGNLLNQNSQAVALGWTTKMSKRTTLYAGYVWVDNDRSSIAQSPLAGSPVSGARDEQNQTFLAGINHTF
jgi:predicted porin